MSITASSDPKGILAVFRHLRLVLPLAQNALLQTVLGFAPLCLQVLADRGAFREPSLGRYRICASEHPLPELPRRSRTRRALSRQRPEASAPGT